MAPIAQALYYGTVMCALGTVIGWYAHQWWQPKGRPGWSARDCKHCGHRLTVDITRGHEFPVWDCPQCKAYWTWVFPPT